ncbi:uncharacterized protein LOC130752201 [Actinidia eriantha]|uniref:uncharacterized protein LOC130752201 n=1 Tax=Actinidia eriantha TaxID=165200 RepID=UPI0025883A98|nr:uncharacterized protein LOC130752201 [Actinidia eriantha]XP_057461986.1 uncharacterized protein LOC130752201 [Actinidia eriantha]
MLENKIGMCAFAQRFHHQAINKAFTERDLVTVFLTQSNIMKKGKVQFLNSHEMKNVAAMKKMACNRAMASLQLGSQASFLGTILLRLPSQQGEDCRRPCKYWALQLEQKVWGRMSF